jgi:hypothetical protein
MLATTLTIYPHLNSRANEAINQKYGHYQLSSRNIVKQYIKTIYKQANSLPQFRDKWCSDNMFDLTNVMIKDVIEFIAFINNDKNHIRNKEYDSDDEESISSVTIDPRSAEVISSTCQYLSALLEAHGRKDLSTNIQISGAIDIIRIVARDMRSKSTLYTKIPINITWYNILDIAHAILDDKIISKVHITNDNLKLFATFIIYLQPLRSQDYLTASYDPAAINYVNLDTEEYIIRDFKTKQSFTKRFGTDNRTIKLPAEIIRYMRIMRQKYPKHINVFTTMRGKSYTTEGFYRILIKYFGLSTGQLRVLYATYVIPNMMDDEKITSAHVMGHTLATQRLDYNRSRNNNMSTNSSDIKIITDQLVELEISSST